MAGTRGYPPTAVFSAHGIFGRRHSGILPDGRSQQSGRGLGRRAEHARHLQVHGCGSNLGGDGQRHRGEERHHLPGFTVNPRDSRTVYAAAQLSSTAWAGKTVMGQMFDLSKGVVYKSTDGGENWRAVWRGDNLARYIWIDPRDSKVLYVSTGIFDGEAGNSDPVANKPGGVGILKSTDGGATWRVLNEANGLNNLYVSSLFMHPTNPDILLAGTGNFVYGDGDGVYLSTDAGTRGDAPWGRATWSIRRMAIRSRRWSSPSPIPRLLMPPAVWPCTAARMAARRGRWWLGFPITQASALRECRPGSPWTFKWTRAMRIGFSSTTIPAATFLATTAA